MGWPDDGSAPCHFFVLLIFHSISCCAAQVQGGCHAYVEFHRSICQRFCLDAKPRCRRVQRRCEPPPTPPSCAPSTYVGQIDGGYSLHEALLKFTGLGHTKVQNTLDSIQLDSGLRHHPAKPIAAQVRLIACVELKVLASKRAVDPSVPFSIAPSPAWVRDALPLAVRIPSICG